MIFIDDRTGSKELLPFLDKGINKELTRLDSADAAFPGTGPDGPVMVGIERKTVTDLIQSMESGRLSGYQLINMLDSYEYNYLVVEGIWRCGRQSLLEIQRRGRWTSNLFGGRTLAYGAVIGYLNTLLMFGQVHPVFLPNITNTGAWISKLYAWWQRPWDKHNAHLQFHVTPPERVQILEPKLLVKILKELKGVGWEKAHAIARHFTSLSQIKRGGAKKLQEVPGIGKVMAGNILEQIKEVY